MKSIFNSMSWFTFILNLKESGCNQAWDEPRPLYISASRFKLNQTITYFYEFSKNLYGPLRENGLNIK